jgi:hypothetical protein
MRTVTGLTVHGIQSQHTPVIHGWNKLWINTQNVISKLAEWSTLKRLGEEISQHLPSGTVFMRELFVFNAVSNKEVSDVDVLSALAAGSSPILFKENSTLVILVDN